MFFVLALLVSISGIVLYLVFTPTPLRSALLCFTFMFIFIHHAALYSTVHRLLHRQIVYRPRLRDKQQNMHLTKTRTVWGISVDDFGVLWVGLWVFRGDSRMLCIWA